MNLRTTLRHYLLRFRICRKTYRSVFNRAAGKAFHRSLIFYSSLVESSALCFDIGASYGRVSEALLEAGARVVAFEPHPAVFQSLSARCGSYDHFRAEELAVGATAGQANMYIRRQSSGSGLRRDWPGEVVQEVEVQVNTLDAMIAKYGVPDYCKIDVEGLEPQVLEGLSVAIPLMSFEFHRNELDRVEICLRQLKQLSKIQVNFCPAETPDLALDDWLAPRDLLDTLSQLPKAPKYEYGDIFVRTREHA